MTLNEPFFMQMAQNKALMVTNYIKSYRFPCNTDLFTLNLNTLILYSGGKQSAEGGNSKDSQCEERSWIDKTSYCTEEDEQRISMLPLRKTSSSYTDPSGRNEISKLSGTFCMGALIKQAQACNISPMRKRLKTS